MKGTDPGAADVPDPGELADRIRAQGEALGVALPGDPAVGKIGELLSLLYRWNRRINLTGIRDPGEGVRRHALEALAGVAELPDEGLLYDLGSGNGFPALPLLLSRPGLGGVLVERVARKVDFLRMAIARLGLGGRVRVEETSIRSAAGLPEDSSVVTMRGFPSPEDWIPSIPVSRPACRVLAWLDQEKAARVASACRQLGRMAREIPLPTRPGGVILRID